MPAPLEVLIRDYGWIHTGLGLIGNALFVAGSVLFLPAFAAWKAFAVGLFIGGSALMLVGSLGDAVAKLYARRAAGVVQRRARF